MAGINAALSLRGDEPLVLGREQAYIGVLIDDITARGTDEPYRMLPSRCEYRLVMRHDNADDRLCGVGRELGLLDDARWEKICRRREAQSRERDRLARSRVPADDRTNAILRGAGSSPLSEPIAALDLLLRPEIAWRDLARLTGSDLDPELGVKIETEAKYAGYVERENRRVRRLSSMERLVIPDGIDYAGLSGLSAEAAEKLARTAPHTLGQASRVPGVNSVDIQLIQIAIERTRSEAS
jgi:tRNA uridine 5-carboxymethylaminomethyl modification enzyme